MKKIVFIFLMVFSLVSIKAQEKAERPLLVFLHTDWCQYCKLMKIKVLNDEFLKNYQQSIVFSEINPEKNQLKDFSTSLQHRLQAIYPYTDDMYSWAHAVGNANGELLFPTILIYDANHQLLFKHSGYVSQKDLVNILEKIK